MNYSQLILLFQLITLAFLLYSLRKIYWLSQGTRTLRNSQELASITVTQQIEYFFHLHHLLELPVGTLKGTRGWAASPDFLCKIAVAALNSKKLRVVECGSGLTTLVLARCAQLKGSGHIVSLESDEFFAESTLQELQKLGLADYAQVFYAPLVEVPLENRAFKWYDLTHISIPDEVDLAVVDGPPVTPDNPMSRYPAFPILGAKLIADGRFFFDDVKRAEDSKMIKNIKESNSSFSCLIHDTERGCAELIKISR